MGTGFVSRYGPWAVVAGGSAGIGLACAEELAARGCNLVVVARDGAVTTVARDLATRHGIDTVGVDLDLGRDDAVDVLGRHLEDREVGLVVWNAAVAPRGRFDTVDPALLDAAVAVNVRGPVRLLRHLTPGMVDRGRGGVVLLASLAAGQGSAVLATYAATKAFTRVFAEGLWADLRPHGVDVVAVAPGATDTPAYRASGARGGPRPGAPADVARIGLDALGGGPVVVPGRANRVTAQVLQRLLPRRAAVGLMSWTARRMYGGR